MENKCLYAPHSMASCMKWFIMYFIKKITITSKRKSVVLTPIISAINKVTKIIKLKVGTTL